MFWRCKRLWPGDPDFSAECFGEQKVGYVLAAIKNGQKFRKQELHEEELATANLTALTANLNRDAKKQKTPHKVSDFCFFADADEESRPDSAPASAFHRLIEQKRLPSWALFVFASFKGQGSAVEAPSPVAAIGEGVVVLAPEAKTGGIEGLLLATSAVSGQVVEVDVDGTKLKVAIPEFEDSIIAREHVFLTID